MADRLFESAADAVVRASTEVVEDALAVLGHGPGTCLVRDPGALAAWIVPRGRRAISVRLLPREADPVLRVMARVLRITADVPQTVLYRRLLERNVRELRNVAFGIEGGEVVLIADRCAPELDGPSLLGLLETVDRDAMRFGRGLVDELGGALE